MSKDAIIKKLSLLFVAFSLSLISCDGGEKESAQEQDPISEVYGQPSVHDETESTVIVDYAESQGAMMKLGQANGSSTTSDLPGEASRTWLQGLKSKVARVWIQQVYVYNKGNIDRNYAYTGGVKVEEALGYYSTTADSLLITLTGYKPSGSFILPTGQAYIDFVRDNILYYKRKYPKIKYITVGNEPNAINGANETPEFYYEQGHKRYYQALNAANAILAQEIPNYSPILLGNGGLTKNLPTTINYANEILKLYKADTDPNKKLSFFNFHTYEESDRPIKLLTIRQQIDNLMVEKGLPIVPVFLTELGNFGGSELETAGFTMAEAVTAQPACQLTKMFYLYEGGVSKIFNWLISHGTLQMKAELLDPAQGIASPYGNTLVLATKLSDLGTRIKGTSKGITSTGLGTHVLAAKKEKSISILVWNYNHDDKVADKTVQVLLKNIPKEFGTNKLHAKTYVIDSKNNNYHINPSQNKLSVTSEADYEHKGFLKIPVKLETNSVVLIELTAP